MHPSKQSSPQLLCPSMEAPCVPAGMLVHLLSAVLRTCMCTCAGTLPATNFTNVEVVAMPGNSFCGEVRTKWGVATQSVEWALVLPFLLCITTLLCTAFTVSHY